MSFIRESSLTGIERLSNVLAACGIDERPNCASEDFIQLCDTTLRFRLLSPAVRNLVCDIDQATEIAEDTEFDAVPLGVLHLLCGFGRR